MLSIYKRGLVWWARGSVRGQRVRRSLDTQFKEEAWLRCQDLERELYTGRKILPVAWKDFADEWLNWRAPHLRPNTLKKYRFTLERFGKFCASRPVQDIDSKFIGLYMIERRKDIHPTKKTAVQDAGLAADLRILHGLFRYAVWKKYLEVNPVQNPKPSEGGKTQPFSKEEVERILKVCVERSQNGGALYPLRPVVLTFLHTGLRIGDVRGLQKSEVDFTRNEITVRTRKRGKTVSIPMHPDLREALKEFHKHTNFAQHASPLFFPSATGKPLISLGAYLTRMFKRAGVEHGHAHRFRDTFAVRLLEAGASLYDVAKLLGTTVTVAERHYAPYTQELRERGRKLIEAVQ